MTGKNEHDDADGAKSDGVLRDAAGRFVPGTAGGPGAKPASTANLSAYRDEIREAVRAGGPDALRQVLEGLRDRAMKGDAPAAKLWLRYYLPRAVEADPHGYASDLGSIDFSDPASVSAAVNAVVRAFNAGEIDDEKAVRLADLIERGANLVTVEELAKKFERLQAVLAERETEIDD